MRVRDYLDSAQLIEEYSNSQEVNRAFGLEHIREAPLRQLAAWRSAHLGRLDRPRWSETFAHYRYGVGLVGGVTALALGLLSGSALLSYSGAAPVNVVYFLALAVGIPLLTMGLAILSMFRAGSAHNALVHLSPASWVEKFLGFLPSQARSKLQNIRFHPRLANWLVIERSQMMAWWFAVGLLLALVGIVMTQDVAFAWSTTLLVSPEQFHRLLEWIALPWRAVFSDAMPSLGLIEQSQYFRLGGTLDAGMVQHASQLGAWWQFLAMATVVYAVGLRLVMWMVAKLGLRRAAAQAILGLDGVSTLLAQMNTPQVTTASPQKERTFAMTADQYTQTTPALDPRYDVALGWAMSPGMIRVILDGMSIAADTVADPGGSRTLAEDADIVGQTAGSVLLLVKAWEPPTMDWVDFLGDLSVGLDRITVAPIGTPDSRYRPDPEDVAIWSRKLSTIGDPKVTLWLH